MAKSSGKLIPSFVKFVQGYPALLIFNKYLAIGDLHIGYEVVKREEGIHVPLQKKRYVEKLKELKTLTEAEELIILGDVKESVLMPFPEELTELIYVFEEASKIFKTITIVQGNHDAYIDRILKDYAKFASPYGLILKKGRSKVCLAHGHARPSDECLKCKVLIMAHMHFYIKYETSKFPVWLIGRKKEQTIILMPPFNDLLSGFYNEDIESKVPFTEYKLADLNAITLEGYNLGLLKNLKNVIAEAD